MTLLIAGSIGPSDVRRLEARLLALVTGAGAHLVLCDLHGVSKPDAGTLEVLARLALAARRLHCRFVLRHPPPDITELVVLAGLADVLPECPDSPADPPLASGAAVEDRSPTPRGRRPA